MVAQLPSAGTAHPIRLSMERPKRNYVGSNLKTGSILMGLIGVSLGGPIGWTVAAGCMALFRKGHQLEQAEREEFREANRAHWLSRQRWPSYQDYLLSDVWREKRERVLKRALYRCEHPECRQAAREVHHLRYPDKWGSEPIAYLQALCTHHHTLAHGQAGLGPRTGTTTEWSDRIAGTPADSWAPEDVTLPAPTETRPTSQLTPAASKPQVRIEDLRSERHVVACTCRGEVEGCARCYGSGEYIKDGLGNIV